MKNSQLPNQSSRDTSPIDPFATVTPPLGQLGQSAMTSEVALDHSGSSSSQSLPRSPTSFVDLVLAQNNNCSPSNSLKLQVLMKIHIIFFSLISGFNCSALNYSIQKIFALVVITLNKHFSY